jgi:hypothetical protein
MSQRRVHIYCIHLGERHFGKKEKYLQVRWSGKAKLVNEMAAVSQPGNGYVSLSCQVSSLDLILLFEIWSHTHSGFRNKITGFQA